MIQLHKLFEGLMKGAAIGAGVAGGVAGTALAASKLDKFGKEDTISKIKKLNSDNEGIVNKVKKVFKKDDESWADKIRNKDISMRGIGKGIQSVYHKLTD